MKTFNQWWLSLPEKQQEVLREDIWMFAAAAFRAGKQSHLELLMMVADAYNQGPDPKKVRDEMDKVIDFVREAIDDIEKANDK